MNLPALSVTALLIIAAPAYGVTLDAADPPDCGSPSPLHQQLGDAYYDVLDARHGRGTGDGTLPARDRTAQAQITNDAHALVEKLAAQRLRSGTGERQRCLPTGDRRGDVGSIETFALNEIDQRRHGDHLLVIHAREETRRNSRHARMDLPLQAMLHDDLVASEVNADGRRLAFRRLTRRPATIDPTILLTSSVAGQTVRSGHVLEISTWLEHNGNTLELTEHVYVNGKLGGWARWELQGR